MSKAVVTLSADANALAAIEAGGRWSLDLVEGVEVGGALPVERIADAEVLFCDHPPANFAEMKSLRYVQLGSSGYAQLAGLDLVPRGIRACNARGVFDVPIAEWNIAMMINLARDLRGLIRHQDSGVWDRDSRFQHEIRGSVVGLWGYGGIGRETARMAKVLGLNVHALTRRPPEPLRDIYGVEGTGDTNAVLPDRFFLPEQTKDFLSGLDFLILAMPMTPANEGIVGEAELRALPDHACVLNPARGPLIREAALLQALREGWIAGAALDTHYRYPMPPEHPLWKFPNVIMTPHISGSSGSPHFLSRVWDIFSQNLQRLDEAPDAPLLNELSEEQILQLEK